MQVPRSQPFEETKQRHVGTHSFQFKTFVSLYNVYNDHMILLFCSSANDNEIKTVDRDAFNDVTRVHKIELNNNYITTLQAKTFSKLTLLEDL